MTVSPEPSRQVPHHAPPKQRLHIVTDLSQQVVSTLLSGVRYASRVQRNNYVKIKFESPEDAREADRRIQRTSGLNFTYSRGLKELLHGPQQGLRRRPNRRPSRSTVADHGPDDGSNGSASSRGHTHASAPNEAAGPEDQQQQQQLDASTPAYQPHQPSPRADATPFQQPTVSSHTPQPTQPGPWPPTLSYRQQGGDPFLSSFNPQQQQRGDEQGGSDPSGSRRYGVGSGHVPMGTHSHRGPSYFPHLGGSFPPQPQPQQQKQQQKQQQDPPQPHLLGGPPPAYPFSVTAAFGGMHGGTPAPWGRNADAQTPQTLAQQGLAGGMPTSHLTPPDPRFLQRTVPPPALHQQHPQQQQLQQPQQSQSQPQQRQPHHQSQQHQSQAPQFPWLDQQPHRRKHQQSQPTGRGRHHLPQVMFDLHACNAPAGFFAEFEKLLMNYGTMRVDRLPTKGTAKFPLATVRFPTWKAEKALQKHNNSLLYTYALKLTHHNRCPQLSPEDMRSNSDRGTTFDIFSKNIAPGYEHPLTQHVPKLDGCRDVHVALPSSNESIVLARRANQALSLVAWVLYNFTSRRGERSLSNVSLVSRETAKAAIANLYRFVHGERSVRALPNTKQDASKDDPDVAGSLKPSELLKPEGPHPGPRLFILTGKEQELVSRLLAGVNHSLRVQRNKYVRVTLESPADALQAYDRIQLASGVRPTCSRQVKELVKASDRQTFSSTRRCFD